jgi:hypothetical protein
MVYESVLGLWVVYDTRKTVLTGRQRLSLSPAGEGGDPGPTVNIDMVNY